MSEQDINQQLLSEGNDLQEANLRAIFENTDTAYVLFNVDFVIMSFNYLAQKYSQDQNDQTLFVGNSVRDYFSAERWPIIKNTLEKVSRGETIAYEISNTDAAGVVKWFNVRWLNVKDGDGQNRGFILANKEITAAKNAELEREKITADLIQHDKDLEQFTYIISHNLRAPVANILGLADMMRNHDLVVKAGGNCAVVNINSIGFGGMAYLRKRSGLVLHAHRNGWDILTRHPGLGMDFKVWQQFWRLLGVDQFQINGIGSKYWEPDDSFVRSFEAVTTPLFSPDDCALPVAGSGQWGGQAPETYERTGRTVDLLYLCGGGIVSHPDGPGAGVRAVQQAWQAAVDGIPLADFARGHVELARAIEKFGDGKAA